MKLLKDFEAVPDGEIYPRTIAAGADCPPELLPQALELGLIDPAEGEAAKAAEDAAAAEAKKAADDAAAAETKRLADDAAAAEAKKAADGKK